MGHSWKRSVYIYIYILCICICALMPFRPPVLPPSPPPPPPYRYGALSNRGGLFSFSQKSRRDRGSPALEAQYTHASRVAALCMDTSAQMERRASHARAMFHLGARGSPRIRDASRAPVVSTTWAQPDKLRLLKLAHEPRAEKSSRLPQLDKPSVVKLTHAPSPAKSTRRLHSCL